jgi:glycosyltransferase involved in cell wall biosynthesis
MSIVIVSNTTWYLLNFRGSLIERLIESGHRVIAIAPPGQYSTALTALGAEFLPLGFSSQKTNPLADFRLFLRLFNILRKLRPNAMLSFTVKPNLYGSLAAKILGIPSIANVTGLGSGFLGGGITSTILKFLYRACLPCATQVFVQNSEDHHFLLDRNFARPESCTVVPGSGVDLKHFRYSTLPPQEPRVFLMLARLLKDKGVLEYLRAAQEIRAEGSNARFKLCGAEWPDNPSGLSSNDLHTHDPDSIVEWTPHLDDVRPLLYQAHAVVLPSYREGLSKVLIEAAACGRPLITTDVAGCRELVSRDVNGIVVQARNSSKLADAMRSILTLSQSDLQKMGTASYHLASTKYREELILDTYEDFLALIAS